MVLNNHQKVLRNGIKAIHNYKEGTTKHMVTFLILYFIWQDLNFANNINISRKLLMKLTTTKSTSTYHKIIKDLVKLNLIKYTPSYHPKLGSKISINL